MKSTVALLITFLPALFASNNLPEIEDGFEHVTCGSTIKLTNKASGYKLHSHGVTYGSGSGQQSVTAFPESDDANSFWVIEAATDRQCTRGQRVPCGSIIRLRHLNTQEGYLHSHQHSSPLSRQQEVSCYDGKDSGDHWRVECLTGNRQTWLREEPVQFVHQDTQTYLSSSTQYQFGQPIPGQLEVATVKAGSKGNTQQQWMAQEGIYFAAKQEE